MLLNLRQLEVFRAIMVAKTISGAAKLLHVSQPGISRLLKHMELRLGIKLFERHKGRLIPTPEGLELFAELDPICQRLDDLDIIIKRITQTDDLQFHIACTPSLSNYILPSLLAKVRKKMPGITVKLESLSNEEIADYLVQRRIDFALVFYSPEHPLLLAEPSISLNLECIVPKNHPLADKKTVSFKEILKYQMVTYYPETLIGSRLKNACETLEAEINASIVVRYANEACAMVEQGMGITIAYQFTALKDRYPTLTTIPIKDEKQQLNFLRHNGIPMSNNVRKFYTLAKDELNLLL